MSKIKIKTPIQDNYLEEKFKRYNSLLPELDNSLELNDTFLKVKDLLTTGLLTEQNYDLFLSKDRDFSKNMSLMMFRDDYISQFGFFIVSEDFLSNVKNLFANDRILEVGSGSGYLSSSLKNIGLKITPTEKYLKNNHYGFKKLHTDILEVDSVDYLKENKNSFDTILMSWPNYDSDFAYQILENMKKGQKLIYIGEGYGGCTGDDQFFDKLDSSALLLENETDQFKKFSWFGIHDKVKIYEIIKD